MKKCSKCNKIYDDSWEVCINCSEELVKVKQCPKCKDILPSIADTCPKCNVDLDTGDLQKDFEALEDVEYLKSIDSHKLQEQTQKLTVSIALCFVGFILIILSIRVGYEKYIVISSLLSIAGLLSIIFCWIYMSLRIVEIKRELKHPVLNMFFMAVFAIHSSFYVRKEARVVLKKIADLKKQN
jgi:RNA polymerase subunit RPABC4/transcription elongation factor Spt4